VRGGGSGDRTERHVPGGPGSREHAARAALQPERVPLGEGGWRAPGRHRGGVLPRRLQNEPAQRDGERPLSEGHRALVRTRPHRAGGRRLDLRELDVRDGDRPPNPSDHFGAISGDRSRAVHGCVAHHVPRELTGVRLAPGDPGPHEAASSRVRRSRDSKSASRCSTSATWRMAAST